MTSHNIGDVSETTALIKSLREGHKLSQTEISRRTGIPQSRLSRWEAGETPTGADDALKLAKLVAELGADPAPAVPTPEPATEVAR